MQGQAIELATVLQWVALMGGLMGLGTTVWSVVNSGARRNSKTLEKHDERFKVGSDRMDRHENRLTAIEQSLRQMPDKDSLHRVELMMAQMAGDVKAMAATMEGNAEVTKRLEAIVSRHEDHLLNAR